MLTRIKHHRVASLAAGAIVVAALVSGGTAVASADAQPTNNSNAKGGVTNLLAGAGYTSTWKAHEFGETVETCPEGQYAIGGGYSMFGGYGGVHDSYDLGGQNTDIQVTVSAPYFKGNYVPVDDAGNFRPDQWVVRGFNHGDADQVVRAWVVCATFTD